MLSCKSILIFIISTVIFTLITDVILYSWQKNKNYKESMTKVFPQSEWQLLQNELLPGDILECPRSVVKMVLPDSVQYSHYGVYKGDREVIHLMANGTVLKESLHSFLEETKFLKKGCRKNNLLVEAEKRDLTSRTREEIVNIANRMYEDAKFKSSIFEGYKLFEFNCQHFATFVRYGEPFSDMVDNAKDNTVKIHKLGRKWSWKNFPRCLLYSSACG